MGVFWGLAQARYATCCPNLDASELERIAAFNKNSLSKKTLAISGKSFPKPRNLPLQSVATEVPNLKSNV
jgi:hypothetical protein